MPTTFDFLLPSPTAESWTNPLTGQDAADLQEAFDSAPMAPLEVANQAAHDPSGETIDNESKSEVDRQLMDLFNEMIQEIATSSPSSVNLDLGDSVIPPWSSIQAHSVIV